MSPIVAAYVPVIHAGYLDFFRKYQGDILVFGNELTQSVEYLSRDLRALSPEYITRSLQAILTTRAEQERNVRVANKSDMEEIKARVMPVVMPDEDVSRAVASDFLSAEQVSFDPIFLRWNWGNVEKENPLTPDREVSSDEALVELMGHAFRFATESPDWWRQVGALLVRDNEVLLGAFNAHMPSEHSCSILGDPRSPFKPGVRIELSSAHHAEKRIIAHAARRGIKTEGADMVVSTFPCPGCAMDIAESGIRRVYYGEGYSLIAADEILRSRNVEIVRVVRPPHR